LQVERWVVVLDGGQRRGHRNIGSVQEQALDATFSLIKLGFAASSCET
jgi:hypothetical protein